MTETKRTLLERILCRLEPLATVTHRLDLVLAELRVIGHKVDRLLERRPVKFRLSFGPPQTRINLPQGITHMADLTLKDTEHVSGTITALDGAGNPVSPTFPAPPAWASSDESIITVSASADGSNADIVTTGKLGTAQITVSGTDADGDAVTGIGNITVVTSGAKTFSLAFGTPVAK